MINISLKELRLRNFKKTRDLTVNFGTSTNIFGHNETGKTTILDAFLWLFFGKDSTDRKDFEIKTLDDRGVPYSKLEHEVSAIINANGSDLTLRRVYKEKWQTKRGSTEQEFTGHVTEYFWDDVPMKQEDFNKKIAALVDENVFKLITNTTYFNSLKWQDRRSVLLSIAGEVLDSDILEKISTDENKSSLSSLIAELNKGKSIEAYKTQISAEKKKIKDQIIDIPSRVDEANRSLPEPLDYDDIELQLAAHRDRMEQVDAELSSVLEQEKSYQKELSSLVSEKGSLQRKIQETAHQEEIKKTGSLSTLKIKINEAHARLKLYKADQVRLSIDRNRNSTTIEQLGKEKEALKSAWSTESDKVISFDDNNFSCPTCSRELAAEKIQEEKARLTENFNKEKAKAIQIIVDRGHQINKNIGDLSKENEEITQKDLSICEEINNAEKTISILEEELKTVEGMESVGLEIPNPEIISANERIAEIDRILEAPRQDKTGDLRARKSVLQSDIDGLTKQFNNKELADKTKARVKELLDQEKKLSQELAGKEQMEYTIESFVRAKMDAVENKINSKFKLVSFKLFEKQINGGFSENCITLVKGVPYPDANTAGKIQAGLDIINVLSDYYKVTGPVWIDNRESVIELPETDAQIINLIVSEKDKKLRIELPMEAAVSN